MFVRVCVCSDHLTLYIKGLTWVAVGGCGGSVRIDGWISILLYRFCICACELYLGNLTKVQYGTVRTMFKTPFLFSEDYIYHCIHLSIHPSYCGRFLWHFFDARRLLNGQDKPIRRRRRRRRMQAYFYKFLFDRSVKRAGIGIKTYLPSEFSIGSLG